MSFIEQRLPLDMSYGAGGGPMYSTDVIILNSGYESRNSNWSFPRLSYNAAYGVRTAVDMHTLQTWFHAAKGRFSGFRIKDWADYKSTDPSSMPAYDDITLTTGGDGTTVDFQLEKYYTVGSTTQTRKIFKPVGSTVVAGIANPNTGIFQLLETDFTVDESTGILTYKANVTRDIASVNGSVTSENPCEMQIVNHGLNDGETAYFSGFSGDWAALNGNRYQITRINQHLFTIPVNTSAFTVYTSTNGGKFDTIPQTGESVTVGFEFDVPVRFDTDQFTWSYDEFEILSMNIPLIELRL